jgi:hypothetical protein
VWRHEFQPGRCISGLVLITVGVLYAADAAGVWDVPWFVAIPLVGGGLLLAALAGLTARLIRGGRRRARDEADGDGGRDRDRDNATHGGGEGAGTGLVG